MSEQTQGKLVRDSKVMPRSRGFLRTLNQLAREAERAARTQARAAQQQYHFGRAAEADAANARLTTQQNELASLLSNSLSIEHKLDFYSLRKTVDAAVLDADPSLRIPEAPQRERFMPPEPSILARLIPGSRERYKTRVLVAERQFAEATSRRQAVIQRRDLTLADLQATADAYNGSIRETERALAAGEPAAVADYFELVFGRSGYPETFARSEPRIAYVSESKQLVVDYIVPAINDIIPAVERYRFVKSGDRIDEVKKSQRVRQSLYTNAISQVVLRCIHEIFSSDGFLNVEVVVLNAFVITLDQSTGHSIRPCVMSVRTTRDEFSALELRNVDPVLCLKRLAATISRSPAELIAVKPIVDINMVDPRFIREQDVLSTLDSRPNLMELTAGEFESLITNLFQKMGLETKLTQPSRDGGVDCVAFDQRPILGGKVVVQAKRYKNTVGVSAVRDLFGTMLNEGASKGILVTTSGYGKAAFEFANGKPIELLTGSNLIYLLKEHANMDVKIEVPEDWVDPHPEGI